MEKEFKLTLTEAICVVNCGWKTEQEKELVNYAHKLIRQESDRKHLEYQLFIINQKLEKLK